jgi:hypothetical protein
MSRVVGHCDHVNSINFDKYRVKLTDPYVWFDWVDLPAICM